MACCSRISEPDSGQKTRYNLRGGQCCPPRILCAKGETAIGSASDCRKNSGERERAAALSRFNRGRHSSRATALCASATSPPESFGFQGGAAGACANAQWHRCVSMYGDHAADFLNENLFSGRKIASLQKFIVPIGRDGFLVGVVVAGEILPRPHYLRRSGCLRSK